MEYKCKVQYLESTGTQYIDTGVKPDFAGGDAIRVNYWNAAKGTEVCQFGCRQGFAYNGFYILGAGIMVICDSSSFSSITDGRLGTFDTIVNDETIRLNGTTYPMPKRITCAYSMCIFALNDTGSVWAFNTDMKLYDWKYYHNGVLAQHLIPVLDNNNVPCLYDTISGQLFYNKGTGQFLYGAVLGPVISAIPFLMRPLGRITATHPRKLQYIESTGTQYIDTGIKPDFAGGDKIEIHSYNPATNSTFGSRQYTNTYRNTVYNIGGYLVFYSSNGTGTNVLWNNHSGEHVLSIDDTNIVDNGSVLAATPLHVTTALPFYLFTFNENGQPHSSYASGMKLYEWKYWKNGTLAQHLIPAMDENDVPCMFDTITGTYYYNAGTGTFLYSEAPYMRKLQYLQSTGTQYIDTGLQPDFAGGDSVEISYYRADYTDLQPCVFGCRQTLYDHVFYVLMRSIRCNGSDIEWLSTIGDHTIEVNDSNITIDGAVYASMPQRVTCTRNMFIFALNNGSEVFGIFSGMKLYDWKYYHNGVLAQHLIPVLDKSGVPCMYDTVSQTLVYNAGTGTFNYT